MRVNSQELPLSAIPLCQLPHVILGLPGPRFPLTCMSKTVLTAPLERSTCPYQRSRLTFRMSSRSSMLSRASISLDLVVTMSCGLTLQICLIFALSFRCRHWRFGFEYFVIFQSPKKGTTDQGPVRFPKIYLQYSHSST